MWGAFCGRVRKANTVTTTTLHNGIPDSVDPDIRMLLTQRSNDWVQARRGGLSNIQLHPCDRTLDLLVRNGVGLRNYRLEREFETRECLHALVEGA